MIHVNQKHTYTQIKTIAKKIMGNNLGEAILVALILPIGFSFIYGSFSELLIKIHPFVNNVFNFFYGAVYTYFLLRAMIKISRNKRNQIFKGFFGSVKGVLNSIGVKLFLMIFPLIIVIINWNIFMSIDIVAIAYDPEAFDLSLYIPTVNAAIATFIVAIISLYVGVRLQFASYIVADTDAHFMTAIKQSWRYSKGNFFRILFFPFAFFFWFLLVFITCGIALIYVIPLMSIGSALLYNAILSEHEDNVDFDSFFEEEKTDTEVIIDVDPLEDLEEETKEKDIFDDYYK